MTQVIEEICNLYTKNVILLFYQQHWILCKAQF